MSATHGDCKNNNAGKHLGYVCPSANPVTAPTPAPVVTIYWS